jgi:hypothetical protein
VSERQPPRGRDLRRSRTTVPSSGPRTKRDRGRREMPVPLVDLFDDLELSEAETFPEAMLTPGSAEWCRLGSTALGGTLSRQAHHGGKDISDRGRFAVEATPHRPVKLARARGPIMISRVSRDSLPGDPELASHVRVGASHFWRCQTKTELGAAVPKAAELARVPGIEAQPVGVSLIPVDLRPTRHVGSSIAGGDVKRSIFRRICQQIRYTELSELRSGRRLVVDPGSIVGGSNATISPHGVVNDQVRGG